MWVDNIRMDLVDQSVSQYVKVSSPLWDLWPDITFCPKVWVGSTWRTRQNPVSERRRRRTMSRIVIVTNVGNSKEQLQGVTSHMVAILVVTAVKSSNLTVTRFVNDAFHLHRLFWVECEYNCK
jgi:hypothetical protein